MRGALVGSITGVHSFPEVSYAPAATGNTFGNSGLITAVWAGEILYTSLSQLELGNGSSSFIYTGAAAVTRAAESLTFDLSALSLTGGSYTVVAQHDTAYGNNNSGNNPYYWIAFDGASHDGLGSFRNSIHANDVATYVGFTDATYQDILLATTDGNSVKYALSATNGAQSGSINGGAPVSTAVAKNLWPITSLSVGNWPALNNQFNGHWKYLAIYNIAYSSGNLQSLSTP